jgi:hypothetical protein
VVYIFKLSHRPRVMPGDAAIQLPGEGAPNYRLLGHVIFACPVAGMWGASGIHSNPLMHQHSVDAIIQDLSAGPMAPTNKRVFHRPKGTDCIDFADG